MTDADEDKKTRKSDDSAADEEVADKGEDENPDNEPEDSEPEEGSAKKRNRLSRRTKLQVLGVAGVVVLAVGVALLAVKLGQNSVPTGGDQAPAAAEQPKMNEFRDPQAGFAVSYPSDWQPLPTTDPQVALLAVHGQNDSFQARVIDLQFSVNQQNLSSVKPLTDRLVAQNKTAKLLAEPQQVVLNGIPGYYYFYTFKDTRSGQMGAHSHFFLFDGTKMITLVFQAVPTETFPRISSTFDRITESFHLLKKK